MLQWWLLAGIARALAMLAGKAAARAALLNDCRKVRRSTAIDG
jgi:hypothetical protein